MAFFILSSL